MPDLFTETNKLSFGENLKNSLAGMIIGIILFLASFVVLWINEGHNVAQIAKANYMEKNAVEVSAENINRENDNKLIQVSGKAITDTTLTDGIITIPNFMDTGENLELEFTNSEGNKILFTESELFDCGHLWATNPSSLVTASLSGKYIEEGNTNYLDFKNATTCARSKIGEEEDESTETYIYFSDYNLIYISNVDNFRIGENQVLVNRRNGDIWTKTNE